MLLKSKKVLLEAGSVHLEVVSDVWRPLKCYRDREIAFKSHKGACGGHYIAFLAAMR